MSALEIHIVSFIVQVQPAHFQGVLEQLREIPGVTVPIYDQQKNKLIVVMESHDEQQVKRFLARFEVVPGVLTINLVYHQVEPE